MTRETVLAQGRQKVAASMSESVVVGTYAETVNSTTLATTRSVVEEHYSGPATITYPTLAVSDREAAGQLAIATELILKVPTDAALLPVGDLVMISASTADANLIGREYIISGPPQAGQVTSHRYPLKEFT